MDETADGYVRYRCFHTPDVAPDHPDLAALEKLRTDLFDAGLIGMRRDGMGFGNLSVRAEGDAFLVTATGTGGVRELGADGYCVVTRVQPEENSVFSRGPLPASSEAMSHGAAYAASPEVRCVVHVHSRELFDRLREEGAAATPPEAACGTPAMAKAVKALVELRPLEGVIVMSGHDEGVLVYGPSVDAVAFLFVFLRKNYAGRFTACEGGEACGRQ